MSAAQVAKADVDELLMAWSQSGPPRDTKSVSQLQSVGLELQRRTASLRDVAARAEPVPEVEALIESFERAVQLLESAAEDLRVQSEQPDSLEAAQAALAGAMASANDYLAEGAATP